MVSGSVKKRELTTGSYRPGEYRTFEIVEPKYRMISAAPYRDRVVHHALCNIIVAIFEPTFIAGSYANRVGFGIHRAFRRFTELARSSSLISFYTDEHVVRAVIRGLRQRGVDRLTVNAPISLLLLSSHAAYPSRR